jgi:hypothetical protein
MMGSGEPRPCRQIPGVWAAQRGRPILLTPNVVRRKPARALAVRERLGAADDSAPGGRNGPAIS